ncbi:MAG TPA: DNA gyrase C-terminal beta-propeller domain-containing protein [Candidatus Nanoarchaeia archaeon]|nr:DNA gyrase C-terminal beta-propeller domain-containing protein [Candidatus Nanoarchaeia archaeon]
MFTTSNLNYLLFFTNQGKVHWLKAYEVPTASRYAKGKAIVNLVRLAEEEKVSTILPVAKFNDQEFITMVTKKGVIKKTSLSEFANPRQGGIRAMHVLEGDELVAAELTPGTLDIIIATKKGVASRFNESDVRAMGRSATGVRGIKLEQGDEVIGMQTSAQGTTLLTIKEDGYGKRTTLDEYRQTHRGGKGIINIKTEGTNDNVVGILMVNDDDEIIIMSQKGIVIRTAVKDVSIIGRNTQGVRLMKTKEGDKVMTMAKVVKNENA